MKTPITSIFAASALSALCAAVAIPAAAADAPAAAVVADELADLIEKAKTIFNAKDAETGVAAVKDLLGSAADSDKVSLYAVAAAAAAVAGEKPEQQDLIAAISEAVADPALAARAKAVVDVVTGNSDEEIENADTLKDTYKKVLAALRPDKYKLHEVNDEAPVIAGADGDKKGDKEGGEGEGAEGTEGTEGTDGDKTGDGTTPDGTDGDKTPGNEPGTTPDGTDGDKTPGNEPGTTPDGTDGDKTPGNEPGTTPDDTGTTPGTPETTTPDTTPGDDIEPPDFETPDPVIDDFNPIIDNPHEYQSDPTEPTGIWTPDATNPDPSRPHPPRPPRPPREEPPETQPSPTPNGLN